MTPNVDERIASVIRSLSEVILPHLPPEASLAQEQAHLEKFTALVKERHVRPTALMPLWHIAGFALGNQDLGRVSGEDFAGSALRIGQLGHLAGRVVDRDGAEVFATRELDMSNARIAAGALQRPANQQNGRM